MSDPTTRSRTPANPPGHTSTHPDPARPAEANVRPSEDQLRAEQWAHLRKYYAKGGSA